MQPDEEGAQDQTVGGLLAWLEHDRAINPYYVGVRAIGLTVFFAGQLRRVVTAAKDNDCVYSILRAKYNTSALIVVSGTDAQLRAVLESLPS